MKSSNVRSVYSRVVVSSLLLSLLCFQTTIAYALPGKGVAAAEITVNGPRVDGEKPFVEVNGDRAFSGRTFFSNGTIATTETSSATINLGKLGRIVVAPSSSLSLSFSEGRIAGTLSKGSIDVSNADGVSVAIDTPDDTITSEGNAPSRFTLNVAAGQTGVAVANGKVRYHNGADVLKDDDDDDDDDDWKPWAIVGVLGGAIAVVVVIIALSDDDEDTVSPVR